jgi:hypothetical protein
MTLPVTDVGSNLEENLERWSKALKGGGRKLDVFKVIYSGKTKKWRPLEISLKLDSRLSPKEVTEVGKRLAGDGLIKQQDGWPVVYEKLATVHHYKQRILALATNKAKRIHIPTKRKVAVNVRIKGASSKSAKASMITVDEIDQFAKVRALKGKSPLLKPLSESKFKAGLQKIFKDTGKFKDWGGEKNDFFTNKVKINGKRYGAAFALKGPGVGVKIMTPGKWGKQGNQIQRLLESPAQVLFLQFEGQIDEYSIDQLRKLASNKAHEEGHKIFYGYIDRDDSLRLRRAYQSYF